MLLMKKSLVNIIGCVLLAGLMIERRNHQMRFIKILFKELLNAIDEIVATTTLSSV